MFNETRRYPKLRASFGYLSQHYTAATAVLLKARSDVVSAVASGYSKVSVGDVTAWFPACK